VARVQLREHHGLSLCDFGDDEQRGGDSVKAKRLIAVQNGYGQHRFHGSHRTALARPDSPGLRSLSLRVSLTAAAVAAVAAAQPDLMGVVWVDGTWANGDEWVNAAGQPGRFQWWRGNGSLTEMILKRQQNPGFEQLSLCVGLEIVLGFNVVLNCSKAHASLCMIDHGARVLYPHPWHFPLPPVSGSRRKQPPLSLLLVVHRSRRTGVAAAGWRRRRRGTSDGYGAGTGQLWCADPATGHRGCGVPSLLLPTNARGARFLVQKRGSPVAQCAGALSSSLSLPLRRVTRANR